MTNSVPKVLIVDDRKDNLVVLESILDNLEIEIIKANSGIRALELMLENDFMLVILDVQMPEMDGFEVADLMKKRESTRFIPVIFVTAISKEKWSVYRGYEVGAVDYLFKPIEPVILKSKVKVFIELFKQKLQLEQQKIMLEEKIKLLSEMSQENSKLEIISMIDALTELPNRRSFNIEMDKYWREAIRDKDVISVMMIDIDHFKMYNDQYGHQQGDEALQAVSQAMKGCLKRPLDFLARYGGEEFVIILPNVPREGAIQMAEKILQAVEGKDIHHIENDELTHVTVSIGVFSIIPDDRESIQAFISAADQGLYCAKKNGRNRVEYIDREN